MEMKKERQGGDHQEGKGKDQRESGDFFELFYAKEMVQGREDKGAGHQPGHERVHDDLNAPINVLIGISEKFL